MINIQIITDEWIDIIYLDNINNIAIRKYNNDKGYYLINDNILKIHWEGWGEENFFNINNIYYNCKNDTFEIKLETNEWDDIGIFNKITNIITRKNFDTESGYFNFNDNILTIKWNNWGDEGFYQFDNGKRYMNNLKDIHKNIKMLAIVFPQFHEIPENNNFWGNGFTEWTLLKNIPRIVNGEIIKQPHNDIGYFNLNDYEHRKYMRILADKYNIFGFCFYHYWFKDKKILYEPTELMLLDGEPNKPFLFCWANEQWTRRWDGGNNEILLMQEYTDEKGNYDHFYYLLQFFKHKNYIKKFNKPIFIFYRIEEEDIANIKNIINLWNSLSIEEGFDGIHFMKFLGPFNNNIILDEIHGYIEFEPGYCTQKYWNKICLADENKIFEEYNEEIYLTKNNDIKELILNKNISSGYEHYNFINEKERSIRTSKFFVYDGKELYNKILVLDRLYKEQHRGICTSWNNTPRRNFTNCEYNKYPHYYKNINPVLFGENIKKLLNKVNSDPNEDDDFIFISAWNEWNEQAILEPNNEDGYDYLSELNNKYLEFYNLPKKKNILNIGHIGGGTEKYINDLKIIFNEYNFIDFINFDMNINYDEIYKDIDIVHINSILFNNLKDNYIYFFTNYFKKSKKYLTIHDYQWLYPHDPNIFKEKFLYTDPCTTLLFESLLELSDKIIFPCNNIYANYNVYINLKKYENKIFIANHMDKIINHNFLVIPKIIDKINIAFIGQFVEYKGSHILKHILNKFIEVKYHIFGSYNNIKEYQNNNNIIFHNKYSDENIIDLLHINNIHGIVHLSLFEESYCYALTNSINSGIPIFYIDRGSLKERLHFNNKYFPTNLENLYNNFSIFLDYIRHNQESKVFYKLNSNIQPNRWYLTNYN